MAHIMEKIVGLRVDVDFEIGLTKGVPYLLKVLEEEDINATFYITFGPDGFKHHRNRINTPGYLKKNFIVQSMEDCHPIWPRLSSKTVPWAWW